MLRALVELKVVDPLELNYLKAWAEDIEILGLTHIDERPAEIRI